MSATTTPLEFQRFYELLREHFTQFDRAALTTADGQTIYLKYTSTGDIGTLPHSAEVSHRYLQIQDFDMVLLNDPYSGGSLLTSPTLVMGISLKPGKADFLVTTRVTLPPHSGPHKTIDDEGLRIPPSPLMTQGQLNDALLNALKGHPLTPAELIPALMTEVEKLKTLRELFIGCIQKEKIDVSKVFLREYLKATESIFEKQLDEWPEGEYLFEEELSAKENLRLHIEIQSGNVKFDFTGTSAGDRVFLTDATTYGACVGSLLSLFAENIPVNAGLFTRLHIVAPRGSMVNASFPQPIRLGHTDGLFAIKNIVFDALGRIHKKHMMGRGAATALCYELDFGQGRFFSDYLASGNGATQTKKGTLGVYDDNVLNRNFSLEKVESEFPIVFLQSGIRSGSGGDGKYRGGHGMTRSLKVLAPCELKWQYLSPIRKPEGIDGGKSALPAEILILQGEGDTQKKVELDVEGLMKLNTGDVLTLMSPGGGGYGTPHTK